MSEKPGKGSLKNNFLQLLLISENFNIYTIKCEASKQQEAKIRQLPCLKKPAELSMPFSYWRWALPAAKLGQLHPDKASSSHLCNTTKYNTAPTFCQLKQIMGMILWTKKNSMNSFPPIIYNYFSSMQQHQPIFLMILLPGRIRSCSMKTLSMDEHSLKHTLIQITYKRPSMMQSWQVSILFIWEK